MTTPWLKALDEIEGSDLPLVGGKAFNLATLRRHGLPVVNGLVVTTAFFEVHLRRHQFVPIWAGSPDVAVTEGALCWLADALKTSPLDSELMDALNTRLAETLPGVESFAIRSSAVDEDTRRQTFSGIHLSELGVPRGMVPVSLTRCWASALSKPALEYRRQHGIPIQSIRLAVLIQPFIRPAAAGVAFTINPQSGARDELVIEATFGHGSAVTSGEIRPARYRLVKRPPQYPLIEMTPGDTPHLASTTGTRREASLTDEDLGPLPALQLQSLAYHLEHMEALMGAPQDVEWAVTEDSPQEERRLVFFQSRPITKLPSYSIPFDTEWSRSNYREILPDLPSPLCSSLLERTRDHALSFFNRLGFNLDNSGPYLKIIYGRPYLNLSLARRLLAQSGLSPDGVLWILGHTELPGTPVSTRVLDWRQMWQSRRPIIKLMWNSLRAKARLSRFQRLTDETRHSLNTIDWIQASPADLLARFRLRAQVSSQMSEIDFVLSAATVAAYSMLLQTMDTLTDYVEQLVRKAVSPGIEPISAQQGRMLLKLARIARAEEQVRRYLARPDSQFANYRQALADTSFLVAFDKFMAQYGQSATFEADPGWPRYDEDPLSLLRIVAQMTKVGALPDQQEIRSGEHQQQPTNVTEIETRPYPARGLGDLLSWRYWSVRAVLRRMRRLGKMRAQLRVLYGSSMRDCRIWDLGLAERWVARGWLIEAEDYFWLTMEEIERALMAEAEVGPALTALVSARRETYQIYATTEMPYALHEEDVTRLLPGRGLAGTALSSVLSGLPVSPGQVQGRVAVLHRPEDSGEMEEGVILVTPSTDTAWFHLFPKARGLIVETGGLLSHGSIITREFGLPAVANIPNATNRFHNGDLVLLDGSTGLVQILDPAGDGPS